MVQTWPLGFGPDQVTAQGSFWNLHWPLSRPVDLPIHKRTLVGHPSWGQPAKKARIQLDSPLTPEDAVELEPTDEDVLEALFRAGSQEIGAGARETQRFDADTVVSLRMELVVVRYVQICFCKINNKISHWKKFSLK